MQYGGQFKMADEYFLYNPMIRVSNEKGCLLKTILKVRLDVSLTPFKQKIVWIVTQNL